MNRGLWYHNLQNGVARLKEKACCCPHEIEICFKDNMSIDLTSGDVGLKVYAYCIISIACFISFFVFLADEKLNGVAIPIYLLYCYLSYSETSTWYIWNTMEVDDVFQKLKGLTLTMPKVKWHIQCYHYETTTTVTTNSDGTTSTSTDRRRVDTHSATEFMDITEWSDFSDKLVTLFFLDTLKAIRIKVFDKISYAREGFLNY